MLGSVLAGMDESPGETILYEGHGLKHLEEWALWGAWKKVAAIDIFRGY